MYWLSLATAVLFLGWADTHTDEIPIVLGLAAIASAVVSGAHPSRTGVSALVLALVPFSVETLAHFGIVHAPYPAGTGLPWPALLAAIPVAIGAAAGYGVCAALRGTSTPTVK